jgi:hypothetical protein
MKTKICPSIEMSVIKRAVHICQMCGKDYQPTGYYQKYCAECKPIAKAAHLVTRHIVHLEEDKQNAKRWVLANLERVRTTKKRWEVKHLGHQAAWDLKHPGANAGRAAAWRIKHPDAFAVWASGHPDEIRINRLKSDQKRCALGFEPINDPFPGCEGHHLDKDRVVYIPKPLHKSVPHDIWTGRNMEQINALALAWLGQTKEVV